LTAAGLNHKTQEDQHIYLPADALAYLRFPIANANQRSMTKQLSTSVLSSSDIKTTAYILEAAIYMLSALFRHQVV